MSQPALHLLGPPRIEMDGEEIHIGRTKAVALLAYLAVTGQPHRREALATLLSPELDTSRAARELRRSLYELNRLLGPGYLVADRQTVRLDVTVDPSSTPLGLRDASQAGSEQALWIDVAEFRQLLAATADHDHPPTEACPDCLPLLEQAVELYQDHFMAGFTLPDSLAFDEWQFFQTEGLRGELAGALERLANGHASQGEYEAGIAHSRRWVALDPLNEPAHRLLMQQYAWSGQRAAALRQYRECERILEEELAASPDEETVQLFEAIRQREDLPPSPVVREAEPLSIGTLFQERYRLEAEPYRGRNNLPAQLTSFVGRERETAEVAHLLGATRLLTLTGPPGTGKTRLGLRVAAEVLDQFQDGVFFVDLAPIRDPGLVPTTIAQVLRIGESGGQPLLDTLKNALRHRRLLLLLDNFEQIVDAAPLVGDLLSSSPGLKALVTSREALRVYGEQVYSVPPLTLPDPDRHEPLRALSQYEAVELFARRARAVRPDFSLTEDNAPAVAEICVRLDGLPLAIELAAARSTVLSPEMMRRRLESRLGVLVAGPRDLPARQRTLRGTIDWSYDLLDPPEKTLFARLAVFQGGRSVEAVEAVCGHGLTIDVLAGLESLLNKNLLRRIEGRAEEPRFVMLEMIHEYAWERLEASGEADILQRRHAEFFLALAKRARPELYGSRYVYWSALLRDEHSNFRTALAWALGGGDAELGLQLVGAMRGFWVDVGHGAEGLAWTKRALEIAKDAPPAVRARVLMAVGGLSWDQGDHKKGKVYHRDALALYRAMGDELGTARALVGLSLHALASSGECKEGIRLCEEGLDLFRKAGDKAGIEGALNSLGELARLDGDYERADRAYQEAVDIARERGSKLWEAIIFANLSYVAYHQGNSEQAEAIMLEVIAAFQELEHTRCMPHALSMLAGPVAAQGNPRKAAKLLGASEVLQETHGHRITAGDLSEIERYVAAVREQLDEATFDAAWAEGRAMSLEQAVSYALGVGQLGPAPPSTEGNS